MSLHAVFDLDGTLVDSAVVFAEVVNAMLRDRRSAARVDAETARACVHLGGRGMVAALLGSDCGDQDEEIEVFRERYATIPTPKSSLYAGVSEGLAAIAQSGVRLSICSNKPQALCEKVLADLELIDLFDAVVGSGPGAPAKPHPAPFDQALQRAGGLRANSCLIGDESTDHMLARSVGVPFVLATYGYAAPGSSFDGALRADDFAAIPGLIARALPGAAR